MHLPFARFIRHLACLIAIFFVACFLPHARAQSDAESPAKSFIPYTIAKPVVTDLSKLRALIIDTLLNNRMFLLADTSQERNTLRIAIKKDSKFYVINPLENSPLSHELANFTVTAARPSSLKFKQEFVELEWEGGDGYGSSGSGFREERTGLQLWDLNSFTRYLDFPTRHMARSWDRATAEGSFSCQSFTKEVNTQSVIFILMKYCDEPLAYRRKVNDTTDRYTYTFQKSRLTLTKKDTYVLPAARVVTTGQPEFLRMISCPSGDRDWMDTDRDIAVGPFWFVDSLFAVPTNEVEVLLHRSGKIIRLCEGTYTADQLQGFVSGTSTCTTTNNRGRCVPTAVSHIPRLTTTSKSFIHRADTVTIYFERPWEAEVYAADLFDDVSIKVKVTGDFVRIPTRLEGDKEVDRVMISTLGRPRLYDEVRLWRPTREKSWAVNRFMDQTDKMTLNASAPFRQMARAYLLGANGYELEAQMILHDLMESNKEEPFFAEAYAAMKVLFER